MKRKRNGSLVQAPSTCGDVRYVLKISDGGLLVESFYRPGGGSHIFVLVRWPELWRELACCEESRRLAYEQDNLSPRLAVWPTLSELGVLSLPWKKANHKDSNSSETEQACDQWIAYQVASECCLDLHRRQLLLGEAERGAPPRRGETRRHHGCLRRCNRCIGRGRRHSNGVLVLLPLVHSVEGLEPCGFDGGRRGSILAQHRINGGVPGPPKAPSFLLHSLLAAVTGVTFRLLLLLATTPQIPQPPRCPTHLPQEKQWITSATELADFRSYKMESFSLLTFCRRQAREKNDHQLNSQSSFDSMRRKESIQWKLTPPLRVFI